MFQHSTHSAIRSAQRGLSAEEIEYVYQYASRFHRSGALIYFLRDKDVPLDDRRKDSAMRLAGTALIVSRDEETLLTAWRNRRKGLKEIRRKPAYSCKFLE